MKAKALLITIIILTMSSFVGVVAAQDETAPDPYRPLAGRGLFNEFVTIISDATGLSAEEILVQLQDGATLAQVVENASGDVDAVMAEVNAHLSERVETLFNTEFDFTGRNFAGLRDRLQMGVLGEITTTITDATGLEAIDIMQQLRDGATLADIISENGGDVASVTTSIVDAVTSAVNERLANDQITQDQADRILENLEETVTNILNGETPFPNRRNGRGRGNN